jgi:hypothetical protein
MCYDKYMKEQNDIKKEQLKAAIIAQEQRINELLDNNKVLQKKSDALEQEGCD